MPCPLQRPAGKLWKYTPDTIACLRRALIIFMLSLLPFQFVWGAAAGYCQHEQGASAKHFGHHAHQHSGKSLKAAGESSPDTKNVVGADDPDCVNCHLSCVSPVMHVAVTFVGEPSAPLRAARTQEHPTHFAHAIERPKWTLAD